MSCSVLPVVSSKSFVDSGLTLRSQAHFEPVSMTGGSGVRGEWRERRGNTHATICESDGSGGSLSDSGTRPVALEQPRALGWGGRWEGGDMCIPMAHPC